MSKELNIASSGSLRVYAQGWQQSDSAVFSVSGTDFIPFNAANWTDYVLPLSEAATGAGFYSGDWTPGTNAGQYYLVFFKQLGAAPAATDERIGNATLLWNGSGETTPSSGGQIIGDDASAVYLVNLALTWLGQERIISLNDDNKRARAAKAIYVADRDATVMEHVWKCAKKRAALQVTTDVPVFSQVNGPNYIYELPSDFLRMSRLEDLDDKFTVNGHTLISYVTSLSFEYIRQLTNVADMDTQLQQAIARRLAADLALNLTGSQTQSDFQWKLYNAILSEARFVDATQAAPTETIGGTTWLKARLYNPNLAGGWADSV